jgi:hypothetical protein
MREAGLAQVEIAVDDGELWTRQRAGQRSKDGALVRVAARPSALAAVLRAADACEATLVGRAALGHSFLDLDPGAVRALTDTLPAGARCLLLDGPTPAREALEPWGPSIPEPLLALMRSVKDRFDPAHVCNPGAFVGGI